ncbi:MAG: proton-conducting membrane transporter [Lachnospiraceae bacterium]|nr:proton-conducting membrane transporter [Lachnospiraceae bacterium]
MRLFYFHADGLSFLFITIITIVFGCAACFATEYMRSGSLRADSLANRALRHEPVHADPVCRQTGSFPHNRRFAVCMGLTYLALTGLCFAGNLLTFYLCYEAMTLLSLPLVFHEQDHEAMMAGLKYLFYSLGGAYMVLSGLFFLQYYGVSLDFTPGGVVPPAVYAQSGDLLAVVLLITILGFSVKAGMFPMHAWLSAAHPVAPSPASAVLSGIIVKSGVLGIIRVIYYMFGVSFFKSSGVQTILLILSLTTVFMGSMLAYREKMFKRRLAYSTISQISYILFGIFMADESALTGSLLHVTAHAFIKSSLFLIAGYLMVVTGKKQVDEYRGLGRKMPVLFTCYLLCSLSLIGIPPTGGFISKWYLGTGALSASVPVFSYLGPAVLLVSALLTAGYLLPMAINGFFPGNVSAPEEQEFPGKAGMRMLVPIITLTALAVLPGIFPGPLLHWIEKLIEAMGGTGL